MHFSRSSLNFFTWSCRLFAQYDSRVDIRCNKFRDLAQIRNFLQIIPRIPGKFCIIPHFSSHFFVTFCRNLLRKFSRVFSANSRRDVVMYPENQASIQNRLLTLYETGFNASNAYHWVMSRHGDIWMQATCSELHQNIVVQGPAGFSTTPWFQFPISYSVPAEICGKILENLRKKLRQKQQQKCGKKCGKMRNLRGICGIICRKLRTWGKLDQITKFAAPLESLLHVFRYTSVSTRV